jgi:hypothetical protein
MDETAQQPSMKERVLTIGKDTLVPLSAVIALLGTFMGYGELKGQVNQNKVDIAEVKSDRKDDLKALHRMELRLVMLQSRAGIPTAKIAPVPKPTNGEDEE